MIPRYFTRFFFVFLFAGGIFAVAQAGTFLEKDPISFPHDRIMIETKSGAQYVFDVEIAAAPDQHAQGLMYRQSLDEMSGMLFLFPSPAKRSFWMKNTLIPLDMLFLDRDGNIHHIHHRAEPQNLSKITSDQPSMAVLEINGGLSDKLEIRPGDTVLHPFFRNVLAE